MSGHADYTIFKDKIPENITIQNVPVIEATEETIKGYGRFIYDFDNEKVVNVKWNKVEGWREIDENTGDQALETEDLFEFYMEDNYYRAINNSVLNGSYITGVRHNNCIYTQESNYHCCGEQIIYPIQENTPFLLLLSKADDNITPNDFVALKFNNNHTGFAISPNIWHQPLYQLTNNKVVFRNKQCSVHSCVTVNTLNEFNTLLCIKLE